MNEDDDWQEMPVVRVASTSSSSSSSEDEGDPSSRGGKRGTQYKNGGRGTAHAHLRREAVRASPARVKKTTTNATGRHLDIDDARGYDWRAKPKGLGEAASQDSEYQTTSLADDNAANKREAAKKKKQAAAAGKGKTKIDNESSESSEDTESDEDEGGARGYTQLRLDDDPEAEEISAASDYLFSGGKSQTAIEDGDAHTATPHSQLNTTKNLLSEGQKIAYVGLVSLVAKNIIRQLQRVPGKELQHAITSTEEWRLRVMSRLFQHMDIESGEQAMIESLAQHGVLPTDLSPSLITTQTVDNPDFDPEAQRERESEREREQEEQDEQQQQRAEVENTNAPPKDSVRSDTDIVEVPVDKEVKIGEVVSQTTNGSSGQDDDDGDLGSVLSGGTPHAETAAVALHTTAVKDEEDDELDISAALGTPKPTSQHLADDIDRPVLADPNTAAQLDQQNADVKTTPLGLTVKPQTIDTLPSALEGVTTELSSADQTITLDLRWTILCDLFLVLTADSVYDARSRVLLEWVAEELGLHWMDVTKFEKRVTDALEIEEGVGGSLKGKKAVRRRAEAARRRRLVMMGLATVGGGLVIGLSAGLMAPLIGAGLGAALGTIGIGGTTGFLGGVGGAAIITTTGTVGGAAIGGTGMSKRTRTVRTFEFKPIHNNKRVNCIVTVGGFLSGAQDDPRLPFSVIDSIMGDVFGVSWEPDMMQEMGNAINLLWNETLVQGTQAFLAATIAGGLVGALAWPLWLTKLGWFIDNPWSNALDRAHSCGLILADVLIKRKLGVRPITLVGFSLGARVIFYCLVELARQKKFGIVQNVYLMGAPVTASDKTWKETRGVVAGRFVNAFSRTDWILGWLFRATTGGLRSIAGLHPVEKVPEVENVDVTQTVPGHLQYRAFMPLVLDELGFRTTADYFDEPEDINMIPEREVRYDEQDSKLPAARPKGFAKLWNRKKDDRASQSPAPANAQKEKDEYDYDEDLPPRQEDALPGVESAEVVAPRAPSGAVVDEMDETEKILAELRHAGIEVKELQSSLPPLPIETGMLTPVIEKGDFQPAPRSALTTPIVEQKEAFAAPTAIVEQANDVAAEPLNSSGDAERLTSRQPSPLPPYARKFSSTIFDADELPAAAPSMHSDHTVSLSFADSYEEEGDDSLDQSYASVPTPVEPVEIASAKQYGLSNETAQELARQFQSSGMSNEGANAAAKLAQDFSGSGQASKATAQSSTSSFEADPWTSGDSAAPSTGSQTLTAPAEPPQTFSTGRTRSDGEASYALTPKPSLVNSWNDNPWG